MCGSAGSIMSIASGFSAMIEAIAATNSGNPIGRWFDETQESALVSVKLRTSLETQVYRPCCDAAIHVSGWLLRCEMTRHLSNQGARAARSLIENWRGAESGVLVCSSKNGL